MNSKLFTTCRILLGIIFLVFGTNGLMMIFAGKGFIPMPPPEPAVAEAMGGFFAVSYLMPVVKFIQVLGGVLLLSGKYINLSITLLAPIVFNILAVHLFIDISGLPIALFVSILLIVLFKFRWDDFKPLLKK